MSQPPFILSPTTGLFAGPPSADSAPASSSSYSSRHRQPQATAEGSSTLRHEDYIRLRAQQSGGDRYGELADRRSAAASSAGGFNKDYGGGGGRDHARSNVLGGSGGGRGPSPDKGRGQPPPSRSARDDYPDRRKAQHPARGRSRSPPHPTFDGPPARQRSPRPPPFLMRARSPPPPSFHDSRSQQQAFQPRTRSPPRQAPASYGRTTRSPPNLTPSSSSGSHAERRDYSPPGGRSTYEAAPPPSDRASYSSSGRREYENLRTGPLPSNRSSYRQDDAYSRAPPPPSSAYGVPSRSDYPPPPPPGHADYRAEPSARDYDEGVRYSASSRDGRDRSPPRGLDPYGRPAPSYPPPPFPSRLHPEMDSYGRPLWQEPAPPPHLTSRREEYPSRGGDPFAQPYDSRAPPPSGRYDLPSVSAGWDERYDVRSQPPPPPPAVFERPLEPPREECREHDRRENFFRQAAPEPNFDLPPRDGRPPAGFGYAPSSVALPLRPREEESGDRRRPPSPARSAHLATYSAQDDRDRQEPRREDSLDSRKVDVDLRSSSVLEGKPFSVFESDRVLPLKDSLSSAQSSRIPTPAHDWPPPRDSHMSSASSSRDHPPPPPPPSATQPMVPIPSRKDSGSSQGSSAPRQSSSSYPSGSNGYPSSTSNYNPSSGIKKKRPSERDESLMNKRPRTEFQPQPARKKSKAKGVSTVLPPPEALKPKPHRPADAVPPEVTKEEAPNILLNYVVSLHRPHVRKRHPAASFQYAPLIEPEEGAEPVPQGSDDQLRCTIVLPPESPVPEELKSAVGEGTRVEGKQEAAFKLVHVLWKCGEIDDNFAPVVDEEELARQTRASACLGITPYRAKVPDVWVKSIACRDLKLYPTLITFPSVPVKPPPRVVVAPPPPIIDVTTEDDPSSASEAAKVVVDETVVEPSSPPSVEYTTPRPLLMFTRLPLPHIEPGVNLYFHEQLSTVSFTNFDALPLPLEEIEAVKAFSLTLVRAVVNRPMIYSPNTDGSPPEGPWYIAPVNLEWYEKHKLYKKKEKAREEKAKVSAEEEGEKGGKKGRARHFRLPPTHEMVDWEEMSRCATETFGPWDYNDPDALEKQCVDAMATGKSEFSRRMEVIRMRRDLNPNSHPEDSPREAGAASLVEFVKTTTSLFIGLTNESQPLLEIRKIPGALGHIRKLEKQTEVTVNKVHDQKYMIPELSQRSTITASTFLSSLYIPSITNRLEQVLLVKELNHKLFKGSLDEHNLSHALTAPSTGGEADYERLEYIGDSCLKYIATTYLYVVRPGENEHLLHDARKVIIANGSLTQNAVDSGLPHYIHGRDFSVKTWYPHNMAVSRPAIMPTERELKYQDIGDKTKADTVEAIIGAAFAKGGIELAYRACKALTVRVPMINSWTDMVTRIKTQIPKSTAGFSPHITLQLGKVQKLLKYKFKDEALLCQALSVNGANHTQFQRLEFFGDSVVDLLTVMYATTKFPTLGPGSLTHMKSAMINYHTTAALAVHLGLQEFAMMDSPMTQRAISEYLPKIYAAQKKEEALAKTEGREPGQYWAEIDAPKILGDLVEAVIAAMLVDSGLNWKTAEDYFNNVQRPWMDKYIRGLGSLAGHPSKMLTEILQARRCQKFEIVKTLTPPTSRSASLAKTEVMVHGNCLGWAIENTPTFSSRRASEFALTAIEAEEGLLDKLCDCVWTGSAKAGGGGKKE